MGNYYALELFAGDKRQIFFSEKGMPPSEFLTVFRPRDRAYPEFTSGIEDSDEPYIPSLAYVVSVPKMTERLDVMGFTLQRLEEHVQQRLAGPDRWDDGPTTVTGSIDRHLRKDRDGVRFLSYLMSLHRIDRSAIVMEYIDRHKRSVEEWLAEGKAPMHLQAYERSMNGSGSITISRFLNTSVVR